jgi:hypothetical protein
MESFFIASAISLVLLVLCVGLFYEVLAHVWLWLPRFEGRPRRQIMLTIVASFIAHTAAVWIFGIAYYLLANRFGFGDLAGTIDHRLLDYVYFSGVTYSSLGLGDVYPTGEMRLLIAVEAILGLILIGWTITYTYLATDKYLAHRLKRHGGRGR